MHWNFRKILVIQKLQINFEAQKYNMFAKSMIKFEEETNVFARYNEKFVNSGVC